MARTYRRDSNGRFASGGGGGGGGGGKKATSTRAANTARARELREKGTTGLGSRVKAKGFAGGKGAQDRAGGLRQGSKIGGSQSSAPAGTIAKGGNGIRGSVARSLARTRGQASGTTVRPAAKKAPAKMSKAPANKAKAAYRAATSKAREAKMMAGGRTSTKGLAGRKDAGAQNIRANVKAAQSAAAKVRKMEARRGR